MLVNGLLAGAEIALVSVRTARLKELAGEGSIAARAALRLRADMESFLATVQVGITVVGAAAGAFGGTAFAGNLVPLLEAVPWLAPHAPGVAFLLVVLVVAYLSVVLGELVPKSLALRSSETYALLAAGPLLVLSRAARPVVWLLAGSSNAVLRLFGVRTTFTEARLTVEEIRNLVREAADGDGFGGRTGEIVVGALEFSTLRAEDVMVPMRHLLAVRPEDSLEAVRRRMAETGRDLLPVLDDRADGFAGYLAWLDLLGPTGEPLAGTAGPAARRLAFVPGVMAAADVLRELQGRRARLAGVVDEHGGTVGIVFQHDLLEEIVGEMPGDGEDAPDTGIRVQPDGSAVMDGTVTLRTVNRTLGLDLDGGDRCRTVGGLCARLAGGRIPAAGERLEAGGGIVLVPVEASPRRVRVVRLLPAPAEGGAPGP